MSKPVTAPDIRTHKVKDGHDPLVMVTAYDAPGARIADEAGVDLILVGDSVAMVVLGYEDTLQVTVDDLAHHTAAVARAKPRPLIVGDLPWMSYHVSVEDTVHLLARHGDVLASYSLNQHQAPNEFTLTIVCERGTIRWESHLNRLSWLTAPGADWQEERIAPLERDTLFVRQADQFLKAVEEGTPPVCSLADGLQTLRVNLAALASADGGGWQTISG